MKHLKSVENFKENNIQIGDYVLAKIHGYSGMSSKEFMYFINNNIGRVIEITDPKEKFDNVSIQYENVPEDIQYPWFRSNKENNRLIKFIKTRSAYIISNSKNIKDIESILMAKKFNI